MHSIIKLTIHNNKKVDFMSILLLYTHPLNELISLSNKERLNAQIHSIYRILANPFSDVLSQQKSQAINIFR